MFFKKSFSLNDTQAPDFLFITQSFSVNTYKPLLINYYLIKV